MKMSGETLQKKGEIEIRFKFQETREGGQETGIGPFILGIEAEAFTLMVNMEIENLEVI